MNRPEFVKLGAVHARIIGLEDLILIGGFLSPLVPVQRPPDCPQGVRKLDGFARLALCELTLPRKPVASSAIFLGVTMFFIRMKTAVFLTTFFLLSACGGGAAGSRDSTAGVTGLQPPSSVTAVSAK